MKAAAVCSIALFAFACGATPPAAHPAPAPAAGPRESARRCIDSNASVVTAVATAAGGRYPLTLRDVSGELELDRQGRPLRAQIEARVDTLVAGSDLVARAAKSPRFLDARRHPTARFEVERFSLDAGGEGDVVGVLTLHGVSKRVRVPVRIEQANGRLRATAEFSIQRSDYGIKPGGALEWVVGDTIAVRARAVSQTGPCTH